MNTVLCRLPNHVGDCCMSIPALRLLEASGYRPSLVGKRWAEDLLSGMGWRFDPIEGHVLEDLGRIRSLVKISRASHGLLLPNSLGSALLFWIGRLPSAGLNTDCRYPLLAEAIPEPSPRHELERFFYVAREAIKRWGGVPAWDRPPAEIGLTLLKRHEAAARNLTRKYALPSRYAVLAPVARGLSQGQTKSWPHFGELVAPLRELGVEPVVVPSIREVRQAARACPGATFLAPTTLGNFAAILRRAQIVVSNDSGVSHLAASLGLRQITLFGVSFPATHAPWNQKAIVLGSSGRWPEVPEVLAALRRVLA